MALDRVPGEQVDYDNLMADESVLRNVLVKLYPNHAVQEFKHTDLFRATGNTILQRRSSDQYKMLNEKVEKLADSIRNPTLFKHRAVMFVTRF